MPQRGMGIALGLASLLAALLPGCGGGGGGGSTSAPTAVAYPTAPALLRVGVPFVPHTPSVAGGTPSTWIVVPDLPDGLTLHPTTGVVSGLPTTAAPTTTHVVTASNDAGETSTPLVVQVTPALPATMTSLEPGFEATLVLGGLNVPVRLAQVPDGRLFFNELSTGNVRVIAADGSLVAQPVTTISVLSGNHHGLTGLVAAPDFATTNELFVYASVPAATPHPDRNQVVRLTLSGDVATSVVPVLDDLPIGTLQNGGEIAFGPDDHLYVSLGDVNVAALAQTPGVLPGRILRATRTGAVPADNPLPGSLEWCRGLRNVFGMAFHPVVGGLFGMDNGPDNDDELNFLAAGKDFGWPTPVAGGGAGLRLRLWPEVIAPTALAWQTAGGFGADYDDSLFVAAYVKEEVLRLEMSGPAKVDVDAESVFLSFASNGVLNKPLHLLRVADGSLLVSTFDAIYRIRRFP